MKPAEGVLTQSSLREPSRLGHEVIPFRDARCPACRNSVVFDGAFIIVARSVATSLTAAMSGLRRNGAGPFY